MVTLTQKNFDNLIVSLNHRISKIEINVKWIKRIIYYMASIGTAGLGILGKIAFT